MTRQELEDLVEYTLDLGRKLMECGAEAWRAENTMARICRAYGLKVLDAHAIATQTALSVRTPDGAHYSATCMVLPQNTGTDLHRLEIINAAARQICATTPAVEDLPLSLTPNTPRWSWLELLGYLLGASGFAVFFGGDGLDFFAAGVIGIAIYLMEQGKRILHMNKTVYIVLACFLSGMLALACSRIGFGHNVEMIMIGDIMIFIPGLSLVNGVRELFFTDILTGVYRMTEAFLGAGAIAIGYAVALMIGGAL